jgi:outer membrane biogenesis lipoprotein LolB
MGALCLAAAGCAARRLDLPLDPGAAFPDYADVYQRVTMACAGVRTLTAELALAGRAGDRSLRGRVIAGFERPASMRLEGVAPFGPPAFILAARGGMATLVLPRDNRVLRGARADEILGALTGVALSPADLQAILTGCASAEPGATGGRLHRNGWASIDLSGGVTLFLARANGAWQPRAARRPGWQVEYPAWQAGFPQTVRLRSLDGAIDVDLTATVSQRETNVPLDASAFAVTVLAGALALTLDELREAGPLRAQ